MILSAEFCCFTLELKNTIRSRELLILGKRRKTNHKRLSDIAVHAWLA